MTRALYLVGRAPHGGTCIKVGPDGPLRAFWVPFLVALLAAVLRTCRGPTSHRGQGLGVTSVTKSWIARGILHARS